MNGKGYKTPPWWGRFHCIALEPCSSFSHIGLKQAVQNNTSIKLGPQEEIKTSFMAIAYENDREIKKIDNSGNIHLK